MYKEMIKRWNDKVGPEDEVYHLGDVSLGSVGTTIDILDQLNGTKHLIWGNHDSGMRSKAAFTSRFAWCKEYHELKIQDEDAPHKGRRHLILCHYPLFTWNKASHGSWMIHGHCHGNIDEINKTTTRIDVGVDSWNYAPVSYQELKAVMETRSYDPVDHHGAD